MVDYISKIQTPDKVIHTIGGDNFDGQWVSKNLTALSIDDFKANQSSTADLSAYFPNDGHNYELLFGISGMANGDNFHSRIYAYAGSNTSGIGIQVISPKSFYKFWNAQKRNAFLRILSSDKKLTIKNAGDNLKYLRVFCRGYRRIGKNS